MIDRKMQYEYPALMSLRGARCVVVGGGKVAERKVQGLLGTGAEIYVISRTLTDRLEEWKQQTSFFHLAKDYTHGDLGEARFVFAATNDRNLNRQIYHDSIAIKAQVNVADQPELCTFTVPSSLRRGTLTIAVSTTGTNPAMAKAIREYLEDVFGPEWEEIMQFMGRYRQFINKHLQNDTKRTAFYQSLLTSNVLQELISKNDAEAEVILGKMLERLEEE